MTRSIPERVRTLPFPLDTRRLRLCVPAAGRDEELVRLLADPSVARWTRIPFPYGRRDAEEFRHRMARERRLGSSLGLQLVRKEDDALVGGIGLHAVQVERAQAELGYWIGRPFRRQGFAKEATERLVRCAFGPLGLHRLEAHVFAGNTASEGVLKASGFRREGRMRRSFPWKGGFRDELLYARLAPRTRRRRV